VLAEGASGGARLAGDTRSGSRAAMSAVARACRAVEVPGGTSPAGYAAATEGSAVTVYDCAGRAQSLLAANG
jgi:hypothetical protein